MRLPFLAVLSFVFSGMPWHVIAGEASSRDPHTETGHKHVVISVNGKSVSGRILGEVTGQATMTRDEFAALVGAPLALHTRETGTEACAMLCRSPVGDWGATITTVDSHIFCPLTNKCPTEMEPTGISIHSHPESGKYRVNAADWKLSRLSLDRGQVAYREDPSEFSDGDFAAGPGYMTTGSALYFQDGPGTTRVVPSFAVVAAQ